MKQREEMTVAEIIGVIREHELAEALDNYTNPAHPDFDPVFNAEIRRLRPDWFDDEPPVS